MRAANEGGLLKRIVSDSLCSRGVGGGKSAVILAVRCPLVPFIVMFSIS